MTQVKDITQRVKEHLEALREFTATPGEGVTRLPFTNEARQAIDYLRNAMEEAGLSVRLDATGALIGRLEGTDPDAPAIMIGSHYDTVRSGGAYDGIAGVVAAIETVRVIRESGAKLRHPIDVCAFNDEEGIMYGIGARFHPDGSGVLRRYYQVRRLERSETRRQTAYRRERIYCPGRRQRVRPLLRLIRAKEAAHF